ncbi:MAG TPA: outer membrane protein transport protein [Pirellulales bacterium]|nr:outer membrane protein transport protein [Pirellulales bacterium]
MFRKWAFAIALCTGLITAATAWADGVMLDGVSPRSLSRGGTNLGFADNGGIIFDDPAAMVNIDGQEMVDIGGDALIVSNQFTNSQNPGGAASTTFTPVPQVSMIRKSDDGVWAYGIGLFTPAGFSEKYNMEGPVTLPPGDYEYESFGALVKILPALACRVTDRLSVGATLGMGYSYAELKGPYFAQSLNTPIVLDTHGAGVDLLWSAGVQYQWSDDTTLGVCYQSPSPFTLRGDASVVVPALGGAASHYDSNLHMEWPQSVGIGIRHQLSPCRVIAADVIWYDWQNSFDQFTLNLHDPLNPEFKALAPSITEGFPLDWRDSVSVRVGYEQQLANGMTFRLGYVYHPNPIPDDTLTPFIQATFEDAVTIGLGWKWNCWDVDVGYAHEFSPQLHGSNSAFEVNNGFNGSTSNGQIDAIVLDFIRRY